MAARPKNLNNTYIAPTHPQLKPIIICGIIMALSARREVIAPGSPLCMHSTLHPSSLNLQPYKQPNLTSPPDDHLLSRSPNALKAATWIQNGLFYFLFGAHAVETALFTKRLNEHGVSLFSVAWFKWIGTCFVGGKFLFEHFDRVVGKTA